MRTSFGWRRWTGGGPKLSFDVLDLAALPQSARGSHRLHAVAQVLKLLKEVGIDRGLVWHRSFLVTPCESRVSYMAF